MIRANKCPNFKPEITKQVTFLMVAMYNVHKAFSILEIFEVQDLRICIFEPILRL